MVVFRDPERSVLNAREHRKHGKPPFAARQNGMSIGPRAALLRRTRIIQPSEAILTEMDLLS